MEKYRLLVVSNESGSVEDVYFLDADDKTPGEDYCNQGADPQTVDIDEIIEANLPLGFPRERCLRRS